MLYMSIVQKWITGYWTFQQAPTEHHFEAYRLLQQMYRVSKNECFFNVKKAYGQKKKTSYSQKNASKLFAFNSLWMVFITFHSLLVLGFLWLTWSKNLWPEIKSSWWNRKIEMWKLASKFQLIFFVKIENRYQMLSFILLVDWKLKFDSSFSIFWKLKIEVRFSFFTVVAKWMALKYMHWVVTFGHTNMFCLVVEIHGTFILVRQNEVLICNF